VAVKPYFERDGITIYHGDCREILPMLPEPAVVVADPPYGVSISRGDGRRAQIQTRVAGDDEPFDPSHLLALGSPLVLFGANAYASRLPDSVGWLIWDKYHGEECQHSQAELAWTNFVKGIRIHREAYHGFMRAKDGWLHPTQKPVGLMRWVLSLPWTPAGLVIDPYMGSGPVLRAAMDLGQPCIGIEIEERYCEIAAKRLSQQVFKMEAAE
jgi:DNA modification methylase